MLGLPELILILLILIIGVGGTVFLIWALLDCIKNEPPDGNEKTTWIVVIALAHSIGALLYFLVRRPKRIQESGS